MRGRTGNNTRDPILKEHQAELAVKYRARSFTFREIAEKVSAETGHKITHVTAFNDYMTALKAAQKKVEKTALYGLTSELGKLDVLEHEYWLAWDRSTFKSEDEETLRSAGEPAFLNGIRTCIELRSKMLGYLTSQIDIKSAGKELAAITGMTVL